MAVLGCKLAIYLIVMSFVSVLHARDSLEDSDGSPTKLLLQDESIKLAAKSKRQADPESTDSGVSTVVETTTVVEAVANTTTAVANTTKAVCTYAMTCGFQLYKEWDRTPLGDFIKYCDCPENTTCTRVGDNMEQRFFYSKCISTAPQTTTESIRNLGITEGATSSPIPSTNETTGTPEAATDSNTGTPIPSESSQNVRSSRKLQDRVGDVKDHAEL